MDKCKTLRPPVLHHVLIFLKQELPLDHLIVLFSIPNCTVFSKASSGFEVAFVVMLDNFYICRKKVSDDYEALNERLQTLPDQLSYDIMVGEVRRCHSHSLTTNSTL